MKGFLKVAANFAIYLSAIVLLAFSFLASNEYVENLLAFYTWCAFILAVCGTFSYDELVKLQRESKTPFWMERVYNFLEFIVILFSACTGHFILAGSFLAMTVFGIWSELEAKEKAHE